MKVVPLRLPPGADAQAAQQEAPELLQRLLVHRHRLGAAQRCFRLAEGRQNVPPGCHDTEMSEGLPRKERPVS